MAVSPPPFAPIKLFGKKILSAPSKKRLTSVVNLTPKKANKSKTNFIQETICFKKLFCNRCIFFGKEMALNKNCFMRNMLGDCFVTV